jgi:two-component system response regulator AtoC
MWCGSNCRLCVNQFSKEFQKNIRGFAPKTVEILKRYTYPGNVRELRNIVEYAANICHGGSIQPEHLPEYLKGHWVEVPQPDHQPAGRAKTGEFVALDEKLQQRHMDLNLDWREMERRMICEALLRSRGSRSKAAQLLGWGRSTLWRKMKQHGLT